MRPQVFIVAILLITLTIMISTIGSASQSNDQVQVAQNSTGFSLYVQTRTIAGLEVSFTTPELNAIANATYDRICKNLVTMSAMPSTDKSLFRMCEISCANTPEISRIDNWRNRPSVTAIAECCCDPAAKALMARLGMT